MNYREIPIISVFIFYLTFKNSTTFIIATIANNQFVVYISKAIPGRTWDFLTVQYSLTLYAYFSNNLIGSFYTEV